MNKKSLSHKSLRTDPKLKSGSVFNIYERRAYGVGIELFIGFLIPFLMIWGIGGMILHGVLWRVVGGVLAGALVNGVTLYRIAKK